MEMGTTQKIFNNFLDNLAELACAFYVASCEETGVEILEPDNEELSEMIREVGCKICDFWQIKEVKEGE